MSTGIENKALMEMLNLNINPEQCLESFKRKESMSSDAGERNTFKLQGQWEKQWAYGVNCGYGTCLLTISTAFRGLLWSLYGPPKCWPKINKLPDISPAKMGLFRISRELQFEIGNHGKPCASPHIAREGECFYRGRKEVGSAIVNKECMAFHCTSPWQELRELFILLNSVIILRHKSFPFWSI